MLGAIMMVTRFFYALTVVSVVNLPYGLVLVLSVWVLVLLSWTAGDLTRTKRLRGQALEDRAHRLEIEAQQERQLAASDERAHIAREMHDMPRQGAPHFRKCAAFWACCAAGRNPPPARCRGWTSSTSSCWAFERPGCR